MIETVEAPTAPTTGHPRARRAWTLLATIACVGILLLIAGFSRGAWWGGSPVAGDRARVVASAKSCIAVMNTYDYRSLDRARTDALACTTGDFTSTYEKAFDEQIAVLAPQSQATQTFQVNGGGLKSMSEDGNEAEVLIFGQTTSTNATNAGTPQYSVLSTVVTMRKVDDTWKVAGYSAD